MAAYGFRSMTLAELPLVNRWLATPAVREWWIEADGSPASPFGPDYFDDPATAGHIVDWGGMPFAFIQDYDPHASPGHHFGDLPAGSRGIDQFIGEPALIGQGHGSRFIRLHADRLLRASAPAIGTDPHPRNARAIRAYEKAGFRRGGTRITEWGPAVLMVRPFEKAA